MTENDGLSLHQLEYDGITPARSVKFQNQLEETMDIWCSFILAESDMFRNMMEDSGTKKYPAEGYSKRKEHLAFTLVFFEIMVDYIQHSRYSQ